MHIERDLVSVRLAPYHLKYRNRPKPGGTQSLEKCLESTHQGKVAIRSSNTLNKCVHYISSMYYHKPENIARLKRIIIQKSSGSLSDKGSFKKTSEKRSANF